MLVVVDLNHSAAGAVNTLVEAVRHYVPGHPLQTVLEVEIVHQELRSFQNQISLPLFIFCF